MQIFDVTRTQNLLTSVPNAETSVWGRRLTSGLQRERRSGRGFPKRFFIPWVIMNAIARESASPDHAVFHSQIFLFQIKDLEVPLAVGPGTRTRQTTNVMAAGMTKATRTSSHVGIVSWCSNGYDIERSTRENGRWKGSVNSKPAPTAAIALQGVSHDIFDHVGSVQEKYGRPRDGLALDSDGA